MVFRFGAAQQVEFFEARNLVEMAVPLRLDAFEIGLPALDDAKAVHGDKHIFSPTNTQLLQSYMAIEDGALPLAFLDC